jgi:hypothetical protein
LERFVEMTDVSNAADRNRAVDFAAD